MNEDDYDLGRESGYEAGYAQGTEDGRAKGYEEGYSEGLAEGLRRADAWRRVALAAKAAVERMAAEFPRMDLTFPEDAGPEKAKT